MEWFYKIISKLLSKHIAQMDQEKRVQYKVRHGLSLKIADQLLIRRDQQKVKQGNMQLSVYIKKYGDYEVNYVFQPLIERAAKLPRENIIDNSSLKK